MKESIVTIGMFDGVHLGHRHLLATLLKEACQRDLQPVVYTFDRHPRQVLQGDAAVQLLNTSAERISRLRQLGDFELVELPFDQGMASLTASQFYERFLRRNHSLRVLVMGYDNSFGNKRHDDTMRLNDCLRRDGVGCIHDVPVLYNDKEISSTEIRRALQVGDVVLANAMLGYRYTLSGMVTAGRHIGRSLGFPTANLDCRQLGKLLPADGVYAVTARCESTEWRAVANLGPQPTVGGEDRVLEVHLIDGNPQLYGRWLQVAFVARLRDIRTFESSEALSVQIQEDIEQCRRLY